jgi:hypothetical protein
VLLVLFDVDKTLLLNSDPLTGRLRPTRSRPSVIERMDELPSTLERLSVAT